MDLLEYQAKQLFREMGIPVLPSRCINHPRDIKSLKIPYPVVLKSQVRVGRRGKAGGVRFVETTIDAVAAAQAIFNLSISGEYPTVLLAEAKFEAEQEFYLAVVLDRSVRRPILMGSQQGGLNIESAIEQVQQVVVYEEFSAFYARRLALKMGLKGPLMQAVSAIIENMYQLFVEKDLDLVEINPLGVRRDLEIMALDGKVTLNDEALARHADLVQLLAPLPEQQEQFRMTQAFDGNIGILCNGAGLALATLDLVCEAGGKPGNLLNIGGETQYHWPPIDLCHRVEQGLTLMARNRRIQIILVNILSGVTDCNAVAATLIDMLQRHAHDPRFPKFPNLVVRLVGKGVDQAQEQLSAHNIPLWERLDDAVAWAIALTESPVPVN